MLKSLFGYVDCGSFSFQLLPQNHHTILCLLRFIQLSQKSRTFAYENRIARLREGNPVHSTWITPPFPFFVLTVSNGTQLLYRDSVLVGRRTFPFRNCFLVFVIQITWVGVCVRVFLFLLIIVIIFLLLLNEQNDAPYGCCSSKLPQFFYEYNCHNLIPVDIVVKS